MQSENQHVEVKICSTDSNDWQNSIFGSMEPENVNFGA